MKYNIREKLLEEFTKIRLKQDISIEDMTPSIENI